MADRRERSIDSAAGPTLGAAAPSDPLGVPEVADRAAAGAVVLGGRGALIFALGLGANLALARLLAPKDFGLVALGAVLVTVGQYLVNSGMGMALISRPASPERDDLAAVLALQLVATAGIAAAFWVVAGLLGGSALVPALMVLSLPITTLRMPAIIMMERQLLYRPQATVDVADAVSYYAFALIAVAAGLGVWGMAAAVVFRAIVGTVIVFRLADTGFTWPRWSWRRVRPVLGFGARIQAITATVVARDQGLNIGIAAMSGIGVLGLWSFANRIMQMPFLLFTTLWRVSFPAMSRLLAAREDVRPLIERGTEVGAVTAGLMLVPIVGGASSLIPALVGDRWDAAGSILTWSSLGLMFGAPVSVATMGYLLAVGDAGVVLRSSIVQTVAWVGISLSLLGPLGASAIGLGWAGSELASSFILGRAAARRTEARIFQKLALPACNAVVAGAAGWALSSALGKTVLSGVAGAALSEAVLVGGLLLFRPQSIHGTIRIVRRALRAAVAR